MSAGGTINQAYEHYGENLDDLIMLVVDIIPKGDASSLLEGYARHGFTPEFPLILFEDGGEAIMSKVGNYIHNAGYTWLLHPNRTYNNCLYSPYELLTLIVDASLEDDCKKATYISSKTISRNEMTLYGTPLSLLLDTPFNGLYQLTVYSTNGRRFSSQELQCHSGVSSIQHGVTVPGTYVVQVKGPMGTISQKMLIGK